MQSQTSAADPLRHLGAQTIEILRRLYPPVGVIHVSADNGGAAFQRWSDLAIPNVWLFSARPTGVSQLRDLVAKTPGWAVECVLLGDQEVDSTAFFVTSNPKANGRIAPELLRPLWPNLRTVETLQLPQCRLDRFLDTRYAETAAQANWLIIDCLPALPVLKGVGRYLEQMDLTSVRAVLDPADHAIDLATLPELVDFLAPRGFRQVAITDDINPALGEVVFIRDWRSYGASRAAILTQERDAQAKLAADRQAQVEQLTQRTKSQDQEIASLKQQSDRFTQLEAQLQEQYTQQQHVNEEMIKAEAQLDLIKDILFKDNRI